MLRSSGLVDPIAEMPGDFKFEQNVFEYLATAHIVHDERTASVVRPPLRDDPDVRQGSLRRQIPNHQIAGHVVGRSCGNLQRRAVAAKERP